MSSRKILIVGAATTACFVLLIISLVVGASLSDLFASRMGIQLQLNNLQKQLTSVRNSMVVINGMKDATDMIIGNGVSVNGVSSDDLNTMSVEATNQYQELTRYSKSLEMKLAVLQRSLEIVSTNIALAGNNANLKRIAVNMYGSAFIIPNGTLYFVGYVENNMWLSGNPAFISTYTASVPIKIDVTPLQGTAITQLYAQRDAFFALTTKGELWHWGNNFDGAGYSSATGYSGASAVLRKVDFGLSTKAIIPKKIVCHHGTLPTGGSFPNVYNPYCYMLTMEGELYFWGIWAYSYDSYNVWYQTKPIFNTNKARKVKIMINGVEKFASDFGLADNQVVTNTANPLSRPFHTACVIDKDDATSIYCLGDNTNGLFADGTTNLGVYGALETMMVSSWSIAKKNPSADGEMFSQIYGAQKMMYAVGVTGKLYSWGANIPMLGRSAAVETNMKIGKTTLSSYFTTTKIYSSPSVDSIFLINDQGYVYILGNYNGGNFDTPYQPTPFQGKKLVDCDFSEDAQVVLFDNGQSYARGRNLYYNLMLGYSGADNTLTTMFYESFFPVYYAS